MGKNLTFIDYINNPKEFSKKQATYMEKCINTLKENSSLKINEDYYNTLSEEKRKELLIAIINEWKVAVDQIHEIHEIHDSDKCQICNHPDIVYKFPIINPAMGGLTLIVGSSCIKKFGFNGIKNNKEIVKSTEVNKMINDEMKRRKNAAKKISKHKRSLINNTSKEDLMKKLTFFINKRLNIDEKYNMEINNFYNLIDSGKNNIDETKEAIKSFHKINSRCSKENEYNCFCFCYKTSMYGEMTYFDMKHLVRFLNKNIYHEDEEKGRNEIIEVLNLIENFNFNYPFEVPKKSKENYGNISIKEYMIRDLQTLSPSEAFYLIPIIGKEISTKFDDEFKDKIMKRIKVLNDENLISKFKDKLYGFNKGKTMDELLGIEEEETEKEYDYDDEFEENQDLINFDNIVNSDFACFEE